MHVRAGESELTSIPWVKVWDACDAMLQDPWDEAAHLPPLIEADLTHD